MRSFHYECCNLRFPRCDDPTASQDSLLSGDVRFGHERDSWIHFLMQVQRFKSLEKQQYNYQKTTRDPILSKVLGDTLWRLQIVERGEYWRSTDIWIRRERSSFFRWIKSVKLNEQTDLKRQHISYSFTLFRQCSETLFSSENSLLLTYGKDIIFLLSNHNVITTLIMRFVWLWSAGEAQHICCILLRCLDERKKSCGFSDFPLKCTFFF